MSKPTVVVSVFGYPKHGVSSRVGELMSKYGGEDVQQHEYYWNSEGYQLILIASQPISDDEHYRVWSKVWDIEDELVEGREGPEWVPDEPVPFEVDGREFLYLGTFHGYHHDSTSPEDERYEP